MKNIYYKKSPLVILSIIFVTIPLFAFGPFQVQYSPTQFSFYQHQGFDRIRAQNFILRGTPGSPELPVKYLHYIIPPNMKVTSVRIVSRNLAQIPTRRYIYPAQPIVPLCSIPPWVPPDSTIYNSDSLYPNRFVEVSNSGVFDGARLVTIAVYPLQYRPQSRRLYVANNISFEFELTSASIPRRANIRGINGQKVYDAALRAAVENDADIPLYYQSPMLVLEEPPPEQPPGGFYPSQYTIITADELSPYFFPFANWLTDKGVPASVVNLSNVLRYWTGIDDAEKLRNYLIDAYQYYGTIWVLLGGDAGIVPFRYGWASDNAPLPSHNVCPSDLYFSDLNGNWDVDSDNRWGEPSDDAVDIYPEVFVGRILCRNAVEVTTWVNKELYYEQVGSSNLAQFTQNSWIYDSLISGIYPDPLTRQLFPSYYEHFNYNAVGANTAVDGLNVGTGFYHIDTHGDVTKIATRGDPYWWNINSYWADPRTQENDGLNNLNNINRYYVVYCTGCYCAAYDPFRGWSPVPSDPSDTTIADAFIDTYESTGAVAFLGNTRWGWPGPSQELDYWFSLLIFGLGTPYEGYWQLGVAEGFSKVYYPYYYLCHAHNLFGSPEMIPWINYPGIMDVEHPTSIPAGIPVNFTVSVRKEGSNPLSDVKVCLNKPGDIYQIGWTDNEGAVIFEICPKTEGELKVTCTRSRSKFDYSQYLPTQTICQVEGKGLSGKQAQITPLPKELSLSVSSPISSSNLKITYGLPKNGAVKLALYDKTGRVIRILIHGCQNAGYYKNTLDLPKQQLTNGVYFLVLELDSDKKFKKITLIR